MNEPVRPPIKVWDAPLRVFHWLLVFSFAGAWLTAESERWRLIHVTLGYTMATLVVFRLLWGLWGTRHARFASFVRGPRAAFRYLASMLRGQPEPHTGHNPAGALAIVALLALAVVCAGLGWAVYNDIGGEWLAEAHETSAELMLGLVVLHLIGVAVGSWMHRENLVRAMVTGRKRGAPDEGIARSWRGLALLLVVAVLGFWAWQWHSAPAGGSLDAPAHDHSAHDHDD